MVGAGQPKFPGIRFSDDVSGVMRGNALPTYYLSSTCTPIKSELRHSSASTIYMISVTGDGKSGLGIIRCKPVITGQNLLKAAREARANRMHGFGALFQRSLCFNTALVNLVLRHAIYLTRISG